MHWVAGSLSVLGVGKGARRENASLVLVGYRYGYPPNCGPTGSDFGDYGTMKLPAEHKGLALGYICKAQQHPLLAGAAHIGGRESVEPKSHLPGTLGHAHVVGPVGSFASKCMPPCWTSME